MSPPVTVYDALTGSVAGFNANYFVTASVPDDTYASWIEDAETLRHGMFVIASITDFARNPFGGRASILYRNSPTDAWHFVMNIDFGINHYVDGGSVITVPQLNVTSQTLEFGIFGGGGTFTWGFTGLSFALAQNPDPIVVVTPGASGSAAGMLHLSAGVPAFATTETTRRGRSIAQVIG